MKTILNIYCDESCHLQNDNSNVMGFGAISCEKDKIKIVSEEIKNIIQKHGYNRHSEIKWTKISPCNYKMYEEIICFFFNTDLVNFRCLLVKHKDKLDFDEQNTYDDFYYKMYYYLLIYFLNSKRVCNAYLDHKDTKGPKKINNLRDILKSSKYDHFDEMIPKIQLINSLDSTLLQLCDILLGAIVCDNRNIEISKSKQSIIELIKQKSEKTLQKSTPILEEKFNLFIMNKLELKVRISNDLQ